MHRSRILKLSCEASSLCATVFVLLLEFYLSSLVWRLALFVAFLGLAVTSVCVRARAAARVRARPRPRPARPPRAAPAPGAPRPRKPWVYEPYDTCTKYQVFAGSNTTHAVLSRYLSYFRGPPPLLTRPAVTKRRRA